MLSSCLCFVRKHRAPKGALRHPTPCSRGSQIRGQKAPSAKRCIKTRLRTWRTCPRRSCVRKHRAPKGALRLGETYGELVHVIGGQKAPSAKRCIKTEACLICRTPMTACQKAPSAKRCIKTSQSGTGIGGTGTSQKAPSAKRCIKTRVPLPCGGCQMRVRKHRAPKGALRPVLIADSISIGVPESESTERQKVH